MDDHLAHSRMIDLLNGRLGPSEVEADYGHLAFCEECAGIMRALSEVRDDFDGVWEEFVATLAAAEVHSVAAPERSGRIRIELGVLVDRARALAEFAGEFLAEAARSAGAIRMTSLPHPAGAGDADAPESSALAEIQIMGPTIGSATVVADAKRNAISILLRPPGGMTIESMQAQLAPRAVLLDPAGLKRRESAFAAIEGADYMLAEFEDLEQVSWVIKLDFVT
jgi:hypothetical protein